LTLRPARRRALRLDALDLVEEHPTFSVAAQVLHRPAWQHSDRFTSNIGDRLRLYLKPRPERR
jgi:hypothetical protein